MILETVLRHAIETFKEGHIILVTRDKTLTRQYIVDYFLNSNVQLHVVADVVEVLEIIKSQWDTIKLKYMSDRRERALEFVRARQKEVFEFVFKKKSVGMSDVRGTFGYWLLNEQQPVDKKLSMGSIECINAIRPKDIANASFLPIDDDTLGRSHLFITVRLDIDLTISSFTEAKESISDHQALRTLKFAAGRMTEPENVTVTRDVYVEGTALVDENTKFTDFKLERVY